MIDTLEILAMPDLHFIEPSELAKRYPPESNARLAALKAELREVVRAKKARDQIIEELMKDLF